MREARGSAVDEKDKARGPGGLPLRVGRKVFCEGAVGTFLHLLSSHELGTGT